MRWNHLAIVVVMTALMAGTAALAEQGQIPRVGDRAPELVLGTLEGTPVRLDELTAASRVALVVLRGYPGYQCPFCTRQVADLVSNAERFQNEHTQVLLVYPGAAERLGDRGKEFLRGRKLPDNVKLVLDPDLKFVSGHGLRWSAPGETAYPATFLIDQKGIVRFARVSREHGGRVSASTMLEALRNIR